MIGDIAVEPEPAEPPVGQIEVDLFAETPLGADTEAVPDDEHADHQLGINRWPSQRAVERRELAAQFRQVDKAVDRPQQMISRHMSIEREVVEQAHPVRLAVVPSSTQFLPLNRTKLVDFHRFNQRVFQQNRPKGDIDAALGSLRKCAAPLLIELPSTRKEEVGAPEINRINGSKDFVNPPTA